MPRPLRVQYPGAIYHVMARGNARQDIFRNDADRLRFLENLGHAVTAHGVRLYLWVLMPNHVHFLLETPHGNLSAFMQSLLTGYTVYFNRQHDSVGHLFQGRFKARVVQGDEYLLKLSRYIHLNPVRGEKALTVAAAAAGVPAAQDATRAVTLRERVRLLRRYRWSTYPGYIGLAPPCEFVDHAPLLALVAGWSGGEAGPCERPAAAEASEQLAENVAVLARLRRAYRRFVETGLAHSDEGFRRLYMAAGLAIGDEAFVRQIEARAARLVAEAHGADPAALRAYGLRLEPQRVLGVIAQQFGVPEPELAQRRRHPVPRAAAAWLLRKYAGLSYRRTAAILGWGSGVAAAVQVRRLQALAAADAALARELREVEEKLYGHQEGAGVAGEDRAGAGQGAGTERGGTAGTGPASGPAGTDAGAETGAGRPVAGGGGRG